MQEFRQGPAAPGSRTPGQFKPPTLGSLSLDHKLIQAQLFEELALSTFGRGREAQFVNVAGGLIHRPNFPGSPGEKKFRRGQVVILVKVENPLGGGAAVGVGPAGGQKPEVAKMRERYSQVVEGRRRVRRERGGRPTRMDPVSQEPSHSPALGGPDPVFDRRQRLRAAPNLIGVAADPIFPVDGPDQRRVGQALGERQDRVEREGALGADLLETRGDVDVRAELGRDEVDLDVKGELGPKPGAGVDGPARPLDELGDRSAGRFPIHREEVAELPSESVGLLGQGDGEVSGPGRDVPTARPFPGVLELFRRERNDRGRRRRSERIPDQKIGPEWEVGPPHRDDGLVVAKNLEALEDRAPGDDDGLVLDLAMRQPPDCCSPAPA